MNSPKLISPHLQYFTIPPPWLFQINLIILFQKLEIKFHIFQYINHWIRKHEMNGKNGEEYYAHIIFCMWKTHCAFFYETMDILNNASAILRLIIEKSFNPFKTSVRNFQLFKFFFQAFYEWRFFKSFSSYI